MVYVGYNFIVSVKSYKRILSLHSFFVLTDDLLQPAINKAFRDGIIQAPFSSDFVMDHPIVQYCDDTLIIMSACSHRVTVMKNILEKYDLSTRLKINFHMSSLIPINLNVSKAQSIADLFGWTIGLMPFTYLGLPLGTTKPSIQSLMMSYSGRVIVVNYLLTSLDTFTMCSIQINPNILEHVEKIRRHCLWNKKTEDGEKCNSLAAWDMVCVLKKKKKGVKGHRCRLEEG
jgi:hypothetical protein